MVLLSGRQNADTKADLMLAGGSGWSTIPVATSQAVGYSAAFNVSNPAASQFASDANEAGVKIVSGDFDNNGYTDVAVVGGADWWTVPIAFANGTGGFSYSNKLCP